MEVEPGNCFCSSFPLWLKIREGSCYGGHPAKDVSGQVILWTGKCMNAPCLPGDPPFTHPRSPSNNACTDRVLFEAVTDM